MLKCCRVGCEKEGNFYPKLKYWAPEQYRTPQAFISVIMDLIHCYEHMLSSIHVEEFDTEQIRTICEMMAKKSGKMVPDFKKVDLEWVHIHTPEMNETRTLWKKQKHLNYN